MKVGSGGCVVVVNYPYSGNSTCTSRGKNSTSCLFSLKGLQALWDDYLGIPVKILSLMFGKEILNFQKPYM